MEVLPTYDAFSNSINILGTKEYIFDPLHSRPFNTGVWTEAPALVGLVAAIWQAHFAEGEAAKKGGKKPGRPYIEQLRVVITDLYLAWREDWNLCLGIHFCEGAWDSRSRYNPHGLSKQVVTLIKRLEEAGLVRIAPGSYAGPGAKGNRTTRIQASWGLQQIFGRLSVQVGAIGEVPGECIILKEGEGDNSKEVDYEDTEETHRMRQDLRAYNDLLSRTFIDIPTQEVPWITRYDRKGQEIRVAISPRNQHVRRIFNRGSWRMNGRFYGPWWQGLGSELRSLIFINDTPTVEIDFKSMHLQLLAAQEGVEVVGDPYLLPSGQFEGIGPGEQREMVKLLVLTALNAKSLRATWAAFRDHYPPSHSGSHLKNVELEVVLRLVTDKNAWLASHLGADRGIGLMYLDSLIMEWVINRCTEAGVPVLTVHDSVIVPYTLSLWVQRLMRRAAMQVLGRELPLEAKSPGLDGQGADVRLDFEAWRKTERCDGYLGRLRAWEVEKERVVVPFGMELRKLRAG